MSAPAADGKAMTVHLTQHLLAIDAPSVCMGATKRPAAVLLWAANGRPIVVGGERGRVRWTGQAALIAPHFDRDLLLADDSALISLNFEPGHALYARLATHGGGQGLIPLDLNLLSGFSAEIRQAIRSSDSATLDDLAGCAVRTVVARAGPTSCAQVDRRVSMVMERVESELCSPPSLTALAASVHLSPDRLSHLFVSEIGLPLRSYALWRRYRLALRQLHSDTSLTQLALQAGFYDQAHMTRTFNGFFGLRPSLLRSASKLRVVCS